MVTVRVGSVALKQSADPKVRVGRIALTGTVPSSPKVRVGRVALTGTANISIAPFAPVTAEPESTVTLTATLTEGGVADSYTWRRVSGPAVTFVGSGDTRAFAAPSAMPPGAEVVIGVTATVGGVTSPERTVTVTVLPQLRWNYQAGAWVGRRPTVNF